MARTDNNKQSKVIATGTFLIERDSTRHSYTHHRITRVLHIWQCYRRRHRLRRHRIVILTAMNPIKLNILWIWTL
jgi:hypothetical protein